MKKLFVLVMVAVIATMLLTACNNKTSDKVSDTTTIVEIGNNAAKKGGFHWIKQTFYGTDRFETLKWATEAATGCKKNGWLVTSVTIEEDDVWTGYYRAWFKSAIVAE